MVQFFVNTGAGRPLVLLPACLRRAAACRASERRMHRCLALGRCMPLFAAAC